MANTEVGSAYVSIFAKVSKDFGSSIDGALGRIGSKFGDLARTAGVAMAGATVAAGAGLAAIGKQALDSYAEYEQLAGGVEKLYGDSADTIMQYAQQAYATAGMSANQYMEQATSFSAALVSSLGGDTAAAAEMTDVAMRAMADNVNVFGSNMEDVQNAFQGFAKGNFTMLDNLKLGYGGTQAEMERLIADANAYAESIGEAGDLSIDSFADIVQAIQYVQEQQGIAGTTANESLTTIQGSITATQAAWANLLTEMGKEDGDIPARVQELIDSATAVITNMTPVVGRIAEALVAAAPELVPAAMELGGAILQGIGDGIVQAFPELEGVLGGIFDSEQLRQVGEAFAPMMESLQRIGEELAPMVGPALEYIGETVVNNLLPALEDLGGNLSGLMEELEPYMPTLMQLATYLASGIIVVLSLFIRVLSEVAREVTVTLREISIFVEFVKGIPSGVQNAIDQVGRFFENLWNTITSAMSNMANAVSNGVNEVVRWFQQLPNNIWSALSNVGTMMWNIGVSIVQGLINGIAANIWAIGDTLLGGIQNAVNSAMSWLGIASPSKLFEYIGEMSMKGLERGWDQNAPDLAGRFRAMTQPLAGLQVGGTFAAAAAGAGSAGGDTYNIYVTAQDGEDVAVRIRNELHAFNIMNGR